METLFEEMKILGLILCVLLLEINPSHAASLPATSPLDSDKIDLGPGLLATSPLDSDKIDLGPRKQENKNGTQSVRTRRAVLALNINRDTGVEWVKWTGTRPNNQFYSYTAYTGTNDWVCKVGCDCGYFRESKGQRCYYPSGGRERSSSDFDVLTTSEQLEWHYDSNGHVPNGAIYTCFHEINLVGRNKYGLGKVSPSDGCFYLPWEGKETWYKSYDVLKLKNL